MSDLRELYQEVILDHAKRPRNFRAPEDANCRKALGHNPLCGDRLSLFLTVEADRVTDVSFQGEGCAISKASASILTETLIGKTVEEADAIRAQFLEMVAGEPLPPGTEEVDLGKLAVFQGVCDYPARVKCASLAWRTMDAAMRAGDSTVTTE
jgi:nitrogen fixation NifU-like protein